MHKKLVEILATVDQVRSADELAAELTAVFATFGYTNYSYLLLSKSEAVAPDPGIALGNVFWLSNLPDEWVRHYDQQKYAAIDPIMGDCAVSRLPIRWTERYRAGKRTPAENKVMGDAWENGIKRGLTVPVHGSGELGIFSLNSELNDREFEKVSEDSKFEIQLIAQYFHEKARLIVTKPQSAQFRRVIVEYPQGALKIYPLGHTHND
jgi:hypothetical protein